jgi:hypothetical protein
MLIPRRSPAKRMIDGVTPVRILACDSTALCRDQLDMDVTNQSGRDLVLHVEQICALLVKALGPQMCALAASTSCALMRVRDRVFWTLPSSTYRTPSSRPIWRASIDLSLYA